MAVLAREPLLLSFKVPTDTEVAPVKVLTPDRVNVPLPSLVRPPDVVAAKVTVAARLRR
jgi:hypothetical protein